MAHRTVFAHNKGGTGKTTTCVNVAGALQKKGKRVLVVDGDPQANATANLGLDVDVLESSLHDLLMHQAGISETRVLDCVYPTRHGIDIIPGSEKLHEGYNILWQRDGRNEILDEALRGIEDRYDHVLIDTPPSQMNAIAAALRAADSFYLVMDPSIFSHHGTRSLRSFLKKLPDRHTISVNPNKVLFVDNRQRGVLERLRASLYGRDHEKRSERVARALFGTRFTKVPYCDDIVKSQREGAPLSHLERVPKEARVFDELADDLIASAWD